MHNIESFIVATLVLSAGISTATRTVNKIRYEYCDQRDLDSLEDRVSNSDVVITGTVIQVGPAKKPESNHEKLSAIVTESDDQPAPHHSRSLPYGLIKVWRVVKGSIETVENYSLPYDLLSSESMSSAADNKNDVTGKLVVKLNGLWNDRICGSFVTEGDTRIFFLRKFPDVRDISDDKSLTKRMKMGDLKPIADVETSPEVDTQKKSGSKVKRKKKKNKTNKITKGKRRKSKKRKKPKKGRKRKRREHGKTPATSWNQYIINARHKRNSVEPVAVALGKEMILNEAAVSPPPRDVLVLSVTPARITLKNLNHVESLAKNV